MGKIALVVEFKLKPGQRDAFIARVRQHGATCLKSEPGCLQFDLLVPQGDADRAFLYEVYADQAALDAHGETPHMAEYRRDTQDMLIERNRTTCDLLGN